MREDYFEREMRNDELSEWRKVAKGEVQRRKEMRRIDETVAQVSSSSHDFHMT